MAAHVDHLYYYLVLVSLSFTLLIFGLVTVFAIRYRRRSPEESAIQIEPHLGLELTWIIIPLLLSLVMFVWGARLFFSQSSPPSDALDIYVVAKQWMWKLQHVEGPSEINELHIPIGRPVRLLMTSQDVIHSFYVPAFRIKQDVLPGRYTSTWFQAIQTGRFHLFCAEYCGTNHAAMGGWVTVMTPVEYERWLSGGVGGESLAVAGQKLFARLGCATCHSEAPGIRGPRLEKLFGKTVTGKDGQTLVVDEAYLRKAILEPRAEVTAGIDAIMPTYKGQVSEEDLIKLVAYVKSLGEPRGEGNNQ
jgi:cytochrome c oxidase subunit 2